jgi:hypothetical protein
MELLRTCYHPDGIDHHTGFDGTVADYVPWVETALRTLVGSMHIVANHLVEFSGDRALSETYATAVHWGTMDDGPELNYTSGVRYVDLVEKREGEWKILERYAAREFSVANTLAARQAPGPSGSRDQLDPIYTLRTRLNGD